MNHTLKLLKSLIGPAIVVGVVTAMWFFRDRLFSISEPSTETTANATDNSAEKQTVLEISSQARKKFGPRLQAGQAAGVLA